MPKVTLMGAGSAAFSRQLMIDILLTPSLDRGSFVLIDIDPVRLDLAHQLAEKVIGLTEKKWSVEASTDRRKLMGDSDYLINFIEVNGLQTVRLDHEIPMKYGIKQCIGDTIGPGGIFKALRTGPDWLDILRDAEELPRLPAAVPELEKARRGEYLNAKETFDAYLAALEDGDFYTASELLMPGARQAFEQIARHQGRDKLIAVALGYRDESYELLESDGREATFYSPVSHLYLAMRNHKGRWLIDPEATDWLNQED